MLIKKGHYVRECRYKPRKLVMAIEKQVENRTSYVRDEVRSHYNKVYKIYFTLDII